jgi:hypothetical protein
MTGKNIRIRLSEDEEAAALRVADRRQQQAIAAHADASKYRTQPRTLAHQLACHQTGCLGEWAAAKGLGIRWTFR